MYEFDDTNIKHMDHHLARVLPLEFLEKAATCRHVSRQLLNNMAHMQV